MRYDYQKLFAVIAAAITDKGSIHARMLAVIDECESQQPHSDWALFRGMNFESDTSKIGTWLSRAFDAGESSVEMHGLYVGLIQQAIDGEVTANAYAAVSPEYDPTSIDWAFEVEQVGKQNFLDSDVLATIYRHAYSRDTGLGNTAEYPLVLSYGAMAAKLAIDDANLPKSLRGLRGAAVGFDDGDFLFLGEFDGGKFKANVRPC